VATAKDRPRLLQDASGRPIVRVGDTVRRPVGPWTPAVHGLLRHLEASGFTLSPRVLGIDDEGREILTYIPGRSGPDGWAMIVTDRGLERLARLLRAYHDAVRSFCPPAGTAWAYTDQPLRDGEIICHGDFGSWNIVWRRRQPVGMIDWDHAGPGTTLDDIAYALEYAAPFRDDEMALRWLAYDRPPDRRGRIERFAKAYGLESTAGLVDQVIARQRMTIERVRVVAEQGVEPQVTWVRSGYLDQLESRAVWSERHRHLFE
jgi:aminoglycoside phosphotransferase